MASLSFRGMSSQDLGAITAIETKVSASPWNEGKFQESLAHHHTLVLQDSERLVGFAVFSIVHDEAELLNIAIEPAQQGKGLGTALLQHVLGQLPQKVQAFYLEVRVSNFSAIRLYKNAGFEEVGLRRDYYPTGHGREDALVFKREM